MYRCCAFVFSFFLTAFAFGETTPCSKHPGQAYSNQGTGACTGNNKVEIRLHTIGFSLVYNSQAADIGYGPGWGLSMDSTFVKTTSTAGILYLEDGTPINFTKVGSQWQPTQRSIYDDVLTEPSSTTVRQTNVDGSVINYTKVGTTNRFALSSITSRKGTEVTITRNASGLITQMRNFFGQDNILAYDGAGKLSSIKDYAGSFYHFVYTGANPTRITYPDGRTALMEYNAASQLVKHTDPKGRATTFTYSGTGADGVLTSVTDFEGNQTTFTYTANSVSIDGVGMDINEVFSSNALGGVTIVKTQNGEIDTSVYDNQGRITQITNHFGLTTNLTYYSTNPFPTDIRYPDGVRNAYVYNGAKKVTQEKVISPSVTLTTDLVRNTNGQITKKTVTGPTGIKAIDTYTLDAKGNLTSVVNSAGKTSFVGVFSPLSLLTSQTSIEGYVEGFTYDAFGNPLTWNSYTGESETRVFSPLGELLSVSRSPGNISISNQFDLIARPLVRARQVSGPSGNFKLLDTKTYQPFQRYGVSQEIFNNLLLQQTNRTLDLKNRPIFLERSAAPY